MKSKSRKKKESQEKIEQSSRIAKKERTNVNSSENRSKM